MSEHRRKPPQQRGRRAAQPSSSGRRAAPPSGATTSSYGAPADSTMPLSVSGGRPSARRAEQGGGGRRRAVVGSAAVAGAAAAGYAAGRGRGRRPEPPPRKRIIDYPRSDRHGLRRWVPSWKQVMGMCVAFMGLILGMAGIALAMVKVPDEANAAAMQQNNVFYWSDGTVMARDGKTNRQNVDISKIPKSMQNAVIAAENKTFYEDSGVDPKGIARAVVNMAKGGDTQGGSTITQQFVKNNYLSQDQTVTRKAKELFISIKAGSTMEKDKILQGYLNTSYYGRNAYGVQAAAQAYFGKDAEEMKPDECALLATVLKGADLYDPAGGIGPTSSEEENKERAQKRWSWILDQEVETGKLSQQERDKYTKFPETLDPKAGTGQTGQLGYLVETAKNYVLDKTGMQAKDFELGGYQVYTTFDRKKTQALEKAVKRVRKENLDTDKRPEKDKYVQFGAASVVPDDGKIVALYGGEGYDKGHYSNNANTLGVPVGSTWKPFVLAAAMQDGTYKTDGAPLSPESKYNGDSGIKIKDQDGNDFLDNEDKPFRQVNDADKDYGTLTVRKAMQVSANTPFVQLGMDVGMDKVRDMAMQAGIREESINGNLNPSFALGTSTPSAIRMADAYATFAASGTQTEPYSVTEVKNNGEEMDGFEKPKRKSAIEENVANNVTDVLKGVVSPEGTGAAALKLNRPAAGKTGTTDENKSAWWVGYTPQLSTSVTMFRTDPDSKKLLSMNGVGGFDSIHGGQLPTEVWTEYMTAALKGKEAKPFPGAERIGEEADGEGVPTPSPTPLPVDEPEEDEPEDEPTEEEPTPTQPEETGGEEECEPFDFDCQNGEATGGETDGQTTGETDGTTTGETDGTTTGETDGTTVDGQNGGNNGNDNGGGGFVAGRGDEG